MQIHLGTFVQPGISLADVSSPYKLPCPYKSPSNPDMKDARLLTWLTYDP